MSDVQFKLLGSQDPLKSGQPQQDLAQSNNRGFLALLWQRTVAFRGLKKPLISVLAIQYRETHRRPGKFADIVETNSSMVSDMLQISVREVTSPNGTSLGAKSLEIKTPQGTVLTVQLNDWVVIDRGEIFSYKNAEFVERYPCNAL